MEVRLQHAADRFVSILGRNPKVSAYREANDDFFSDPELAALRKRYNDNLIIARKKQYDGTLTQEELNTIRALQTQVSNHPITQRFVQARAEILDVLNECNSAISELLGFNYAQVAAPPANCG
ncbi:MAG: YlbF family regulator [Rectinema subterraneum]|uniref:YlbF family regulator n=1 Tax=Rectinema subterraneum TaxID=2653714 RepID=UPI003C7AEB9E